MLDTYHSHYWTVFDDATTDVIGDDAALLTSTEMEDRAEQTAEMSDVSRSMEPEVIIEEKIKLRRELNLPYASALMTGIIIGSGIFVSPVSITQHCGSIALSLIMWIVSGILTLGITMCYAEMGVLYPKAGGDYAFFKVILSPFMGFLNVWVQFVAVKPTFYAVLSLTTSNYLLKPLYPDCDTPSSAVTLLSLWILLTLAVVNSTYVRHVAKIQVVFTLAKLIALLIIIMAGITQLAKGRTEILSSGFDGTTHNPGSVAMALVSGLFTYGGWNYFFNLLEETKNPKTTVPRASVLSITTVILLYVMTNIAYFTVMTPAEMAESKAVALTFAERTLGPVAILIPILVACSTIGALNGALLGGSRKYFAAARDGVFPDLLSTIQIKYRTPLPSLWATCALAVFYIVAGDAVKLIEYLGFVDLFIYGTAMVCVIYLRIKQPHVKRDIKVPLFVPVLVLCLMILAFILGLYKEPLRNGIGTVIILTGIPVYYVAVKWKSKPAAYTNIQRRMTCFIQKLLLVVPEG